MRSVAFIRTLPAALLLLAFAGCASAPTDKPETNPYAEYVWPKPPDEPRIGLVDIVYDRTDVEAETKLRKALLDSDAGPYDRLLKPHAVHLEAENRILVTDSALGALLRFDLENRKMDVLGVRGSVRLRQPLGLAVGADGTIYVADIALAQVVAYNPDGSLKGVFGSEDELTNPTDAALSPDGRSLYVADSKAHQIVVYDVASGQRTASFGTKGSGPGEFHAPTSLAFNPDGELFVVDQLNARVQLLTADGEYVDSFGSRGIGFGKFVRPKDVAVDRYGLIYVTDAAFNNVQIFDIDFSLLTFVGAGGKGPGEFSNITGVSVLGEQMVLVDQTNRRFQVFRYLFDRGGE